MDIIISVVIIFIWYLLDIAVFMFVVRDIEFKKANPSLIQKAKGIPIFPYVLYKYWKFNR